MNVNRDKNGGGLGTRCSSVKSEVVAPTHTPVFPRVCYIPVCAVLVDVTVHIALIVGQF